MKDLKNFGLNQSEFIISTTVSGQNITIGITDFEIGGLNSWKTFDLLKPVSSQNLASQTELSLLDLNVTFKIYSYVFQPTFPFPVSPSCPLSPIIIMALSK